MNTDITDTAKVTGAPADGVGRAWLVWMPAVIPTVLGVFLRPALAPWVWMWAMAVGLFLGAKWLTASRFLYAAERINTHRLLAYCFLWPGMDVQAFCAKCSDQTPTVREWVSATCKTIMGLVLTVWSVSLAGAVPQLLTGWLGMIGLVLVLHFGLFDLVSLLWRTRGVDAVPIMNSPLSATSLVKFWGGRWNAGFHELMHRYIFRGLAHRLGPRAGLFGIFLISGLVHELVISVPARGGYGGPAVYFFIQALGILLERGAAGRRLGLGHGLRGWFFVALVTAAPVGLLFHPPFIRKIILPMLQAIGAVL